MSKTIKHFKTERIMVLHEGKNDQGDSAEFLALALTPLDFDGASPDTGGYADDFTDGYTEGRVSPMPFFAFGDIDEDDEDDMEDDDFDDNESDFDDEVDEFDDEKDDFNFIKDDYDDDIDDEDDDEDDEDDDDIDDDDEE